MYTLIWQEDNQDKWDRLETKTEVIDKLKEIEANENASPIGDVWIFAPKADDYAFAGDEFLSNENR